MEATAAAAGDDVKIIGAWVSPFVLRTRVTFNIKGVKYQHLEEDLAAKSDLLLKSNPVYKKVPVLLHNGRPICESTVIVQYIDDVWTSPPGAVPLLPADPYDRATHRFWAFYVDDKLVPELFKLMKAETDDARKETVERLLAVFKLLEEALEVCSKGKGFFNGDDIGYLDISLGSLLGLIRGIEQIVGLKFIDSELTPLLTGWAESFYAHEAVKGVMPETEKLVHYAVTVFLPRLKAASASN